MGFATLIPGALLLQSAVQGLPALQLALFSETVLTRLPENLGSLDKRHSPSQVKKFSDQDS
jgi:hypothetical protein